MKIYAPIKVIEAVKKIEKEHPLVAQEHASISEESLYELIQRINRADKDELDEIVIIVSKREVQSLCRYLQDDRYHADLEKIAYVIQKRFDSACFRILFRVWQQAPEQLVALRLLGNHDTKEFRPEEFPLQAGVLLSWANARLPIVAVTRYVQDAKGDSRFHVKYAAIGLDVPTLLFYRCYLEFLKTASLSQFEQEEDHAIADILPKYTKQDQEEVLLALLKSARNNRDRLLNFPFLYESAHKIWGDPNRNTFPHNHSEEYSTYHYWHATVVIYKIFGKDSDRRRVNFWQQYRGNEDLTWRLIDKHSMLTITSKDRVVTEFLQMGPVYIYEKKYFDDIVSYKIMHNNTAGLKSWMVNDSDYLSRETHSLRWEVNEYQALNKYGFTKTTGKK